MAVDMSQLFNNVPDEEIYMNEFDLSFDNVFSTEIGRLTPIFCRRVLPGEKWRMSGDLFARLQPLLSPVFGKMDMYVHAFYCTNRSLSNVWENYIKAGDDGETEFEPDLLKITKVDTEQYDYMNGSELANVSAALCGLDSSNDLIVMLREGDLAVRLPFAHGSLFDYLNVGSYYSQRELFQEIDYSNSYPDIRFFPHNFSLLPFKAYQAIWSEYYADANVQYFDNIINKKGQETIDWKWLKQLNIINVHDVPEANYISCISESGFIEENLQSEASIMSNLFKLRQRCFAKDYFTSSLPEPQRGPDVLIPIDADITISNNTDINDLSDQSTQFGLYGRGSLLDLGQYTFDNFQFNGNKLYLAQDAYGSNLNVFNANQLRAEISTLSATITDLRTAIKLQEFYESSARYGNRYKEFVYGHFGSMIPDDQLTRPWYLGGFKLPIQISEVLQTAPLTDTDEGVGNMFGRGVTATNDNGFLFEREFDDYGLIMVIMSIRPHNYYKNTIHKEWVINDRLEEYWRKLQGVGEEELKTYEIGGFGYDDNSLYIDPNATFGYQMRYSNYKFNNDEVHGDFKGDLSYWTMCRDFSHGVTLSPEFLSIHPREFNHIFQYEALDTDHFLISSHLSITRETPMDIYSIPRI